MALARSSGLALAALLVLAGCGHTDTYAALLREPSPAHGRDVELYMIDGPQPNRPWEDVGLVQAVGYGADAEPEDVARALVQKAAELGCDAVVKVVIDVGYSRANAVGLGVRYTGPAPVGVPAPIPIPPHGKGPKAAPAPPSPSPKIDPMPSAPNQGR